MQVRDEAMLPQQAPSSLSTHDDGDDDDTTFSPPLPGGMEDISASLVASAAASEVKRWVK